MKGKYSEEQFRSIVEKSHSLAEVMRHLGLCAKGGNYYTIKKYIKEYNIDVSHFTSQRWNLGARYLNLSSRIPLDSVMKENTLYSSDRLRKRLIYEGLKEEKCECCGNKEWLGKPIPLELHHINGDHCDNRFENLQILCPNCHSLTTNYRSRNGKRDHAGVRIEEKRKYMAICQYCGKTFKSDREGRKFCSRECYDMYLKKDFITETTIKDAMDKYKTISGLSEYFKVSRTSIRKFLKKYNLYDKLDVEKQLHSKRIIQLDLDGNFIKEWGSISDAEKTLHIFRITDCANGKQVSAGGFKWKFK